MREFVIIVFALASLIGGAILNGCTTPKPALEEPPITIVDASDASALLDVGASPDLCQRECASFAKGGCVRIARADCVDNCRMWLRDGMLSEAHVDCYARANGDRDAMQRCGKVCQ